MKKPYRIAFTVTVVAFGFWAFWWMFHYMIPMDQRITRLWPMVLVLYVPFSAWMIWDSTRDYPTPEQIKHDALVKAFDENKSELEVFEHPTAFESGFNAGYTAGYRSGKR